MDNNIYNPLQPNSPYPMYNPINNLLQQQVPVKMEITKVNGQNGANALNLAPYSSALLLDMNDPIVWFVSTDGAGYKTCIPYDIPPHVVEQEIDVKELVRRLNARLDNIEERMASKNESHNAIVESTAKQQRTEWNL